MGCCDIFGLIFLIIHVVASVVSFVTPYWVDNSEDYIIGKYHAGLLAECNYNSCKWLFENDMILQKHDPPDWFQACQGLMSVGLAAGLFALLLATLALCCTCKACNPNHGVATLLVIAFLAIGVAIVVFAVKASNEWHVKMQWGRDSMGRLGWSFWVAVGAAVMALLTASIYSCMGRKSSS